MVRKITFCICALFIFFCTPASANKDVLPETHSVIWSGLPDDTRGLLQINEALFQEYQQKGNLTTLVFYSWGLLKLAGNQLSVNDYVHASESSRMGLFYLDEAVEAHPQNWRVRYLRARMDAWLPVNMGRCVVALKDTEELLEDPRVQQAGKRVVLWINSMRYRALLGCHQRPSAEQLRPLTDAVIANSTTAPGWSDEEARQILFPVMEGQ